MFALIAQTTRQKLIAVEAEFQVTLAGLLAYDFDHFRLLFRGTDA